MRLFFALWPSGELSRALAARARGLARRFGGRAAREGTIHLTLAFLGEIDAAKLSGIVEAARRVEAAAFDFVIDRLGYWRHNRLLWAGCAAAPESLTALAGRLRESLLDAGLAFDAAPRFVPHLTLVRKAGVPGADIELPAPEPLAWACSGFDLVESRPAAAGRDYAVLESFPLRLP